MERWEPYTPLKDQTFLPFPPPLLDNLVCHDKENIHNPFLPTNWQKTGSEKAWRMPITPELLVFISSNMAGEGKEEEQQGHRACYMAGPTRLGPSHLLSFL